MFRTHRAYLAYRKAVLQWGSEHGYDVSEIVFVYPWSMYDSNVTSAVVVFINAQTAIEIPTHISIYRSNHLCIYEKKPEVITGAKLRHGVPTELFAQLLTLVRQTATLSVVGESQQDQLVFEEKYQSLLNEECTIDVTVWVGGFMRGCRIASGGGVLEMVRQAAQKVVVDGRYKPILPAELQNAQFELVIIPNTWLPVTSSDMSDRVVVRSFATRMLVGQNIQSWYMPGLANQREYSTAQYYQTLKKKAKLRNSSNERVHYQTAPSFSCIESTNDQKLMLLDGVIPQVPNAQSESLMSPEALAASIVRVIDADGYMPIIHPATSHHEHKLDVVRLAGTYYALREYALLSKNTEFEDEISRLYEFTTSQLDLCTQRKRDLAESYLALGELCDTSSEKKHVKLVLERGLPEVQSSNMIACLQATKVFAYASENEQQHTEKVLQQVQEMFLQWSQKKDDAQVSVLYADLLPLLHTCNMQAEVTSYLQWLQKLQLENGSVVGSRNDTQYVWTRGVSKIAECCAWLPEGHRIAKPALGWLSTMQYTDETMYHIPKSKREIFKGGFRHDYWNRDLHFDANAHALLATARLKYFETHTARLRTY
jgi:hypothetical protein